MFCTFLNASKALDRINYVKLFELIAHRMLPPVSVWFQLYMYTSRIFRVSWNGICSVALPVLNGVKQGGVISLVLFFVSIWMNFLVKWLMQELAATLGMFSFYPPAHADDIVLLAPVVRSQRLMLALCDNYALEYSILFNAK